MKRLSAKRPTGENPSALIRARLDVGIAKDLLASLYSLKRATKTLVGSSRRLEGLTRWLVGLTVVLAVFTSALVYDVVRRILLGN